MPDLGLGVQEIRIHMAREWRVVYVANRPVAVYVSHAFEKKSQQISVKDLAAIRIASTGKLDEQAEIR